LGIELCLYTRCTLPTLLVAIAREAQARHHLQLLTQTCQGLWDRDNIVAGKQLLEVADIGEAKIRP
jgi:hypothetical protein